MPNHEPATERQLEFAKDLGIDLQPGATKEEVSALISEKLGQKRLKSDNPADDRHLVFAHRYGIEVIPPIGKKELFDRIFTAIKKPGREMDMASWFVYRVYREIIQRNRNNADFINGPDDPTVQQIALKIAQDTAILKSMRRYEGREIIWFGEWTDQNRRVHYGGSNQTTAYKRVAALLLEALKEISI